MAPRRAPSQPVATGVAALGVFQVRLGSSWVDVEPEEDQAIKHAMMEGHLCFTMMQRGFTYEVDLIRMEQRNVATGKTRPLRPSPGGVFCEDVELPPPPLSPSMISTRSVAGNSSSGTSSSRRSLASLASSLSRMLPSRRKTKTAAKTGATAAGAAAMLGGGAVAGDLLFMDGDYLGADEAFDSAGDFLTTVF